MTDVAVVGAGISGLVAAYRLRRILGDAARIVLIEETDRVGGKLRSIDLGSGPLDVGAEAFLARRPEVPALLDELGLADQLVRPSQSARPLLRSGGALHPLPTGTLMGIPSTSQAVRGLVDDDTCRRIDSERDRPLHWSPGDDAGVGALVSERFGVQVTARSVDPLLGGVYSSLSETTSIRAAVPTLAAALDAGAASLSDAVERARPTPVPGPVFGGLRGGYGILLDALASAAGARNVTATVRSVTSVPGGRWHLDTVGEVEAVGEVDAVVVATPAPVAAGLLAGSSATLGAGLASIPLASSAVVTLALPSATLPDNSGVLVATGETGKDGKPLRAKAFTLSSRKWPHLAERGGELVRVSFGRYGDADIVDLPDPDLVAAARADLRDVLDVDDEPSATFVQRWHGGLPLYRPGHVGLVADIEAAAALVPRLEIAGAYLHGVGVPACIATADAAARRVAAALV